MTKLILIRGNDASRITSLTKRLQAKLNSSALVISQDLLRREIVLLNN
ncbi:hypothetical protein [Streptococcus dysgalactiae]|nr:hypothetical protein [Streptococcus dysgalactiae]MCB2828717.1 hypothetical protein [Streptococcus dysgalactiae subsp. dysgalactiae]MCB2831157.1 hypothetical protein [Streptococcus dysgalactiae subsp. dysgalactiae]MCB2834914.1 hypothetical protein [Streptococcus dysgalactiae subsp. dysgalactiae]MCB2836328.1 hypothetical protein [Streptococcus dysgalactiae subsp. dysgalactiae]MCB2838346.1 hypothetical protein [Streptococcus dysgalactiae subsp. dysgalactiae]